jgi:hypothetical protein
VKLSEKGNREPWIGLSVISLMERRGTSRQRLNQKRGTGSQHTQHIGSCISILLTWEEKKLFSIPFPNFFFHSPSSSSSLKIKIFLQHIPKIKHDTKKKKKFFFFF